ncbi:cellulase family glycosylhydrolase [Streptomyces sioyaensis]|uniref:cellulase family glycosylhydrolase n=1 Tax=Streptomyces sioyaensis TaxID=67364 RepID=UPI0026BA8813
MAVLAQHFALHPAVYGYDLINEPTGRLREGEDLPAAAHRIESGQLTPMYKRIAGAIHTADRHHRLFVEPTPMVGDGLPTGLGRIHDPDVVYAPHSYNATMEAGGDYDPSAHWMEAHENAVTRHPSAHHLPFVVGELGPRDSSLPNMARFYGYALASLDRYRSGWAGYLWCYGSGYCAVDKDGRFLRTARRQRAVHSTYGRGMAGVGSRPGHGLAACRPGRGAEHDPGRASTRCLRPRHGDRLATDMSGTSAEPSDGIETAPQADFTAHCVLGMHDIHTSVADAGDRSEAVVFGLTRGDTCTPPSPYLPPVSHL